MKYSLLHYILGCFDPQLKLLLCQQVRCIASNLNCRIKIM